MVASGLVWMAFIASVIAAYAYFQSATQKKHLVNLARRSFLGMAAAVVAASVLLMVYILRHQFEYGYIWSYSSRDLPTHLLITTFWAGQEGSFMFWALCSTIIGFALLNYTRTRRVEYETMAVYSVLQSFLLLLLIAKSPFKYIWDEYPNQAAVGMIPADGRGLNPLLQNFWMIIHPPVLFIGFAAMAVPFSFAVAALWRRTYSDWIHKALPWTYFSAIALGAGLMLGGYWAYGVLGWGGWWGWDPVENSSLVPWIIGVTLIHTLLVQKKTGKLIRTNFALAILAFLLVIYSTFLTRSGILGDASVHSFVDPGAFAYALLVLWMLTVGGMGFLMLASRWSDLKKLAQGVGLVTRESLISIGSIAMAASAAIILFGTSWPLVGNSTVEPSFYDSMNLPIAVALGIILGLSLLVQWRMESVAGLAKRSLVATIAALLGTVLLYFIGVHDWSMLALSCGALFAVAVNVRRGIQLSKQSLSLLGGVLSHIGLATLFLGIIASGRYGQKKTASLPLNQPVEIFGHSVTYTGSRMIEGDKYEFKVEVRNEKENFSLDPVMFQSSFNNSLMREPDYASFWSGDFYLEPVSLETQASPSSHVHEVYRLNKGEPQKIEDATITFLRFDMSQHGAESMADGSNFVVGAVLEIQRKGSKEELTVLTTFKQGGTGTPTLATSKDGGLSFEFISMNIDMETKVSMIDLSVTRSESTPTAQQTEMLVVEASLKPFMSLVWIAAVFIMGGLALALYTYVKQGSFALNSQDFKRSHQRTAKSEHVIEPSSLIKQ